MKIIVENSNVVANTSKKGNPYFTQYVIVEKQGKSGKILIDETQVFIDQNDPYPKGTYVLDDDTSVKVTPFGFQMGSGNLIPIDEMMKRLQGYAKP